MALNKSSLFLTLGLCLLSSNAFSLAPELKAKFCQASPQQEILDSSNRMSFRNPAAGLLNGGLCWWHSRFLRNSNYLSVFDPAGEKPILKTVKVRYRRPGQKTFKYKRVPAPGSAGEIIKKIIFGSEVVRIPGYSNLQEFTADFRGEIIRQLEGWQIEDGFIKQQWVAGLMGSTEVEPDSLKNTMDKLYQKIEDGEVVYQKLQMRGIMSHAWLVVGMTKESNGYTLKVVDSNYSDVQTHRYYNGEDSFHTSSYGNFVPYTGRVLEFSRIQSIRDKFCN